MKPDVYSAGDYAGIRSKNFKAYYGYEVTDENDEWCFKANFGDTEIIIPFSKLKASDKFDCADCLMVGVGWLFQKYMLSLP